MLRILGYSRWQVLVSFFLESLLLAFIGGLLGCAVGLSKGLNPDAPSNLTRFVKLGSDGTGGAR